MNMPFNSELRRRWQQSASFWWSARSARERSLLSALVGVILVIALIALVIRPLQTEHAAALANIKTYEALQTRLLTTAAGGIATTGQRTGDPSSIVTSSAAQFGVLVRNVSLQGRSIRVEAPSVSYDAAIRWLTDLRATSDLRIARLSMVKTLRPGEVDVLIVFVV